MPERALLLLFAAANFAIGLGAFVAVGVLSPIAATFALSKADAGWVMTAYSLAYAIASPLLVALTGRIDRARLIAFALALFALASALAAAAPDFATLVVARALMAVGAGLVTPVAATIAATLAGPERRGKALSLVFGGFTVAQALGVPAGSWIGYAFGWRWAFAIVAVFAAAATLAMALRTPRGLVAPGGALSTLWATLRSPRSTAAVSLTAWAFGAVYCVYTFLAPFLEQRFGLGRDGITGMFALFGLCGVAGNWVGGLMTDRAGPERTVTAISLVLIVVLPLVTAPQVSFVALVALMALLSLAGFAFMSAQQARLVALDPAPRFHAARAQRGRDLRRRGAWRLCGRRDAEGGGVFVAGRGRRGHRARRPRLDRADAATGGRLYVGDGRD